MRTLVIGGLVSVAAMLSACAAPGPETYQAAVPQLDFRQYFDGEVRAWGIVQNWRGAVIGRFDLTMEGQWEGDSGTLQEHFRYYSGREEHRTWKVRRLAGGHYEGRADDVIGIASGHGAGNALQWNYVLELPVDGRNIRLRFDDWMWQMNDGVLINRSYMKKFGFTVAELTVFMQKQLPEALPR